MFEFSLENGKKQLVGGLICLIFNVIVAVLFVILLASIPNETAILVITIIFGIAIGILSILTLVKLIFGIVVYHAERTASRNEVQVNEDYSNMQAQKEAKERAEEIKANKERYKKYINVEELSKIKDEDTKEDIKNYVDISRWDYDKNSETLTVYLTNNNCYYISNVDTKFRDHWKNMSWDKKTKVFYTVLIKKAKKR